MRGMMIPTRQSGHLRKNGKTRRGFNCLRSAASLSALIPWIRKTNLELSAPIVVVSSMGGSSLKAISRANITTIGMPMEEPSIALRLTPTYSVCRSARRSCALLAVRQPVAYAGPSSGHGPEAQAGPSNYLAIHVRGCCLKCRQH